MQKIVLSAFTNLAPNSFMFAICALFVTTATSCSGVYYSEDYRSPDPKMVEKSLEERAVVRVRIDSCGDDGMYSKQKPNTCELQTALQLSSTNGIIAYGEGSFEALLFGDEIFDGTVEMTLSGSNRTSVEGLILIWPSIATLGTLPAPGAVSTTDYSLKVDGADAGELSFRQRKWVGWIPSIASRHERYYDRKWNLLANQIVTSMKETPGVRSARFANYLKATAMIEEVLAESRFDDLQPFTKCVLPKLYYLHSSPKSVGDLKSLFFYKALYDCQFFAELGTSYAPTLTQRIHELVDAMVRLEKRWQTPLFGIHTIDSLKNQDPAALLADSASANVTLNRQKGIDPDTSTSDVQVNEPKSTESADIAATDTDSVTVVPPANIDNASADTDKESSSISDTDESSQPFSK